MSDPATITVIVRGERREYRERIDVAAEREYFDELQSNGANPHIEAITFAHWTREISLANPAELKDINGNHFLFGWWESFTQSSNVPEWMYSENIEGLEVTWA